VIRPWQAGGHHAAVCFSVDDVHPGRAGDCYEAGGDLERGALGHVAWLLERHPRLRVTLFVTADWRQTTPWPTRTRLARVPGLARLLPLAPRLPAGTMRLERHPEFNRYLRRLPRTEIALHGLHHYRRRPRISAEFVGRSRAWCRAALRTALDIFAAADLPVAPGLCPPGWEAPPPLLDAMADVGLGFVASARDTVTPVASGATTAMSGLRGVSLLYPAWLPGRRVLSVPTNFQGPSPLERAHAIVEHGGLLSIKAHIVKRVGGYVAADGLDEEQRARLDALFTTLEQRYGDALSWTTMGALLASA
jgi:hypothetical protein